MFFNLKLHTNGHRKNIWFWQCHHFFQNNIKCSKKNYTATNAIQTKVKKLTCSNFPYLKKKIHHAFYYLSLQNIHPAENGNEEYYKTDIHFRTLILWEQHYHLELHKDQHGYEKWLDTYQLTLCNEINL